jgi:hypothetical protein
MVIAWRIRCDRGEMMEAVELHVGPVLQPNHGLGLTKDKSFSV